MRCRHKHLRDEPRTHRHLRASRSRRNDLFRELGQHGRDAIAACDHIRITRATTISAGAGVNAIALPSIATGTKATITINAGATEIVISNIGTATDPGSLVTGLR